MMDQLKKVSIGTGIHYPIPLHLQKAYSSKQYKLGDFPVCEKIASEIISLPMFPQLTTEQQTRVVEQVLLFAETAGTSDYALRSNAVAATEQNA
jgi:dTDP-4-amino-4,6-dideoxygalactose transaminase